MRRLSLPAFLLLTFCGGFAVLAGSDQQRPAPPAQGLASGRPSGARMTYGNFEGPIASLVLSVRPIVEAMLAKLPRNVDTEPPVVQAIAPAGPVGRGRVELHFRGSDNSGRAAFEVFLFEDGAQIFPTQPVAMRTATGTEDFKVTFDLAAPIDGQPKVTGPLYFCVRATDAAGNQSKKSEQECAWVPVVVPIEDVSNGCGGAQWGPAFVTVQNWFWDRRTYSGAIVRGLVPTRDFPVTFSDACNLHDAGYAGVVVRDDLHDGQITDFRTWSRQEVDDKFLADLRSLCTAQIRDGSEEALEWCLGSGTDPIGTVLYPGAGDYYRAVRAAPHQLSPGSWSPMRQTLRATSYCSRNHRSIGARRRSSWSLRSPTPRATPSSRSRSRISEMARAHAGLQNRVGWRSSHQPIFNATHTPAPMSAPMSNTPVKVETKYG